jgi:hypothetical protein
VFDGLGVPVLPLEEAEVGPAGGAVMVEPADRVIVSGSREQVLSPASRRRWRQVDLFV